MSTLIPIELVEVDADAAEDVDELRMGADAGAAAGEVLGVALEHDDVPADVAQQMRRQQPAERAADHQRATITHQAMAQGDQTDHGPAGSRGPFAWDCG